MHRAAQSQSIEPGFQRHLFCVAPMMDCTDRHDRYLLRLFSRHALLYTEMITSAALINGDRERLLKFDRAEHPVALQVGGSDPDQMAECARYAEDFGYDEININVGCPSDRVQSGRIGACLMAEPDLVAECVDRMRHAVALPITIKTRIGIDYGDTAVQLDRLVSTAASAGCQTFIVHARKAWLKGLSPKQNREVPPLDYSRVYRLKQDYNYLEIVINGGLNSLQDAEDNLEHVDGVMLGRAAYANPQLLADVDRRFFGSCGKPPTCEDVLERYMDYCRFQLEQGCKLSHLTRHIVGLFQGQPGARHWRRYLSDHAPHPGAGVEVISRAASARLDACYARSVVRSGTG